MEEGIFLTVRTPAVRFAINSGSSTVSQGHEWKCDGIHHANGQGRGGVKGQDWGKLYILCPILDKGDLRNTCNDNNISSTYQNFIWKFFFIFTKIL